MFDNSGYLMDPNGIFTGMFPPNMAGCEVPELKWRFRAGKIIEVNARFSS
jgi:hypothetical protein